MKVRFYIPGLTAVLVTVSSAAIAIDRNGNYTFSDFFPTKDEYALATWKVVTASLNCRQQPSSTAKILGVFRQGDPLAAKTSNGSHDNEGFLQLDAQGKPWMQVYLNYNTSLKTCFVRAHRAYIAPVVEGASNR